MEEYNAVFLGVGLGDVKALGLPGEDRDGVRPAVECIAELRQTEDPRALPVGRRVVVIGGGMTAVDAAVQAKPLSAEEVTMVYRRGRERMAASRWKQDLATAKGVRIVCNAVPKKIEDDGAVPSVEFACVRDGEETGETFALAAEQVLTAIGQRLRGASKHLELDGGKIRVSGAGRTRMAGVWAGGGCATGGDDLTVTAVAEGRDAAMDIHAALTGEG